MHLDTQTELETIRRFSRLLDQESWTGNPLLEEFRYLLTLCEQLEKKASALHREQLRLNIELGEMARSLDLACRIDPMTGLANRRALVELLEQETSRASRHHRACSLLLVDVDDFRRLNDRYGYNLGDDVLVELALILREALRQEDCCARWGGEQFVLLLPETPLDGAMTVAEKLVQTVAQTEFRAGKPGVRLTVSIGVCEFKVGERVFDVVARAEAGLHKAKASGKNRCLSH